MLDGTRLSQMTLTPFWVVFTRFLLAGLGDYHDVEP